MVPFLSGFSMGGMPASALGAKYGISTIGFNGLGLSPAVIENFIGRDKYDQALASPQAHISIATAGDHVADPLSSAFFRQRPGKIYRVPSQTGNSESQHFEVAADTLFALGESAVRADAP
jgi:hypothetical protein